MPEIHYRLAPRAKIAGTGLDLCVEMSGSTVLTTRARNEAHAEDLAALQDGVPEDGLRCAGDPASVAAFFYVIELLYRSGLVEHFWRRNGSDLVVFRPLDRSFVLRQGTPPANAELCADVYLRPTERGWTLQAAHSASVVELLDDVALHWVSEIARDRISSDAARDLRALLWRHGFLQTPESGNLVEACWEFHDLLFHHGTRRAGYGRSIGGTCRFRGRFPPPPAAKPAMSNDIVPLADGGFDISNGRTLADAMSQRRTCRRHDDANPVTLSGLSAFLHRCARTRRIRHDIEQELLMRPYPSGGAIHELEFYPVVRLCDGLDPGVYHYDGLAHHLYRVAPDTAATGFIEKAAAAWGDPESLPQILVIGTSRHPRLAWKYEGIAYRLTLLHAGVALQTMYLVATDLGLGGAALGTGDSEGFARVTGLDPREETAVLEFALGTPAD